MFVCPAFSSSTVKASRPPAFTIIYFTNGNYTFSGKLYVQYFFAIKFFSFDHTILFEQKVIAKYFLMLSHYLQWSHCLVCTEISGRKSVLIKISYRLSAVCRAPPLLTYLLSWNLGAHTCPNLGPFILSKGDAEVVDSSSEGQFTILYLCCFLFKRNTIFYSEVKIFKIRC